MNCTNWPVIIDEIAVGIVAVCFGIAIIILVWKKL